VEIKVRTKRKIKRPKKRWCEVIQKDMSVAGVRKIDVEN